MEGKITEKTDKYVKLEFEGVVLVYYNDEIASIEQDTANNSGEVSPQLESLYKAYVSSLQAPKKPTPPVVTQKITKPTLQSTPETQDEQVAESTNTKRKIAGVDFAKLPPEYQEMIKATLAQQKASSSKALENK